jgi:hypothetical protein
MEKNLPFVSLSIADKAYNKIVLPFLGKLDDGNVFQKIINLLLSVLAIFLLLGGVFLSFTDLFGDAGFIETAISRNGLTGGKITGSVFGLILGFPISILTAWALYSVLKKRAEQMKTLEFNHLLSYIFIKIIPKLILVVGELLFVLFLYVGILVIISALVGSYVYAPLSGYPELLLGAFPGMEFFTEVLPSSIVGDYDYFEESIKGGFTTIAASVLVLIAFYIYKEIYNYALKLVTNLISFLPKFAIPLAIRKRNDN